MQIITATQEQTQRDSLGGGFVLDSALYDFTVKLAYVTKSSGGAWALNVELETDDKKTLKHTMYITTKEGKTYSEKDGKQTNLPGFNLANSLCLLAARKEFTAMVQEDKIVPVYDADTKGNVHKSVPVLVELLGQRITAGVLKQVVDKTKDSGKTDAQGKKIYVATGETREQNEIDKFFRAKDGFTVAEILAKETTAVFKDQWGTKFTGVIQNKAKGASAGGSTGAASTVGQPAAQATTKSLFDE